MYKERENGKIIVCKGKTRGCCQEEFGERCIGDFHQCVEDGCINKEDLKDEIDDYARCGVINLGPRQPN